jgi:ATP-dependent Clp protease ATP-binding subunit ClpA
MFERFTDRARRVVVLAQEEARMLKHNYIGTEHILLGLIRERDGMAAQVLESLGISLDAGPRRRMSHVDLRHSADGARRTPGGPKAEPGR